MTRSALQISSGAGPAEVRRFVRLLAARLERVALERGLTVLEVETCGDADEPRSVTLHLQGDAAAVLADELGTHALIARSRPSARSRWFAAVTLHPASEAVSFDAASLPRDALAITACRAGGPGGQHVNKVSTAVRVEHVPSGLSVRCTSERSQKANLDRALARLAALLQERADAARASGEHARRRAHYQVERGRAIRTYALAGGELVERRP